MEGQSGGGDTGRNNTEGIMKKLHGNLLLLGLTKIYTHTIIKHLHEVTL